MDEYEDSSFDSSSDEFSPISSILMGRFDG